MFAWYEAVVEANRRFNLTRITDPAEAAVKHFADSLAVLAWCEKGVRSLRQEEPASHPGETPARGATMSEATAPDPFFQAMVLDVGTGAGFPSAPLSIMRPDWQVTAIDSTGKKARFVADTAAGLGLTNFTSLHARTGQWKPSAPFDLVLFKAVGSIGECLTDARRLVRTGGYALHFKTTEVSAHEEAEAHRAASKLGFAALPPYHYVLRLGELWLKRVLWAFQK